MTCIVDTLHTVMQVYGAACGEGSVGLCVIVHRRALVSNILRWQGIPKSQYS